MLLLSPRDSGVPDQSFINEEDLLLKLDTIGELLKQEQSKQSFEYNT